MRGSEGVQCILASTDVRDVQQRPAQPLAEQALASRGGAVVQGAHQTACPAALTALQYLRPCDKFSVIADPPACLDVEVEKSSRWAGWVEVEGGEEVVMFLVAVT